LVCCTEKNLATLFQIAGHGSENDGQRAILKRADGKILKPVQPPPKGRREVEFYRDIEKSEHPDDVKIRNLIPEFFGVESIAFR
jgi:1D-myo-inositol-tetrakisphosphate 5-kinase/inositol-polyphosphate multikinase